MMRSLKVLPDFSKYFPATHTSDFAPLVAEMAGSAYPPNSKYVNMLHYYQNQNVLLPYVLKQQPHPVSLKQLSRYYDDERRQLSDVKIINSARFVKSELTVRIAHKLHKLQQLPFQVINNYHFIQVYESYYDIFNRFRRFPNIQTIEDNEHFVRFANNVLTDHNLLNLPHLIMGSLESCILDLYPQEKMDDLISELLRARISRRLMVEEHLSLTGNYKKGKYENILVLGDIFKICKIKDYLLEAKELCCSFAKEIYGPNVALPEFKIDGEMNLEFYFLPTHLRYMLGEILRNSYIASIQQAIKLAKAKPEPITVTVIKNEQNFMFRVSDLGGGVPYDDRTIWSFGKNKEWAQKSLNNFHKLPRFESDNIYSFNQNRDNYELPRHAQATNSKTLFENTSLGTLHSELHTDLHQQHLKEMEEKFEKPLMRFMKRAPRYQLGIGLALCKVYAEYWNGDLTVHSISGYGTDTVLKIGNLMYNTDRVQLDKV